MELGVLLLDLVQEAMAKFKLRLSKSQQTRCTKQHLIDSAKQTTMLAKTTIDQLFSVLQINTKLMVNKMKRSKDSLKNSKRFFINSKCSNKRAIHRKCSLLKMIKRMPSFQRLRDSSSKLSKTCYKIQLKDLKTLRKWDIFNRLTVEEIILSI